MKTRYPVSQLTGQSLLSFRKEKGLSGAVLAQKMGISQQQLSRYERGQTAITVDTLFRLLTILCIPFAEFYTRVFESLLAQPVLSQYLPNLTVTNWELDLLKDFYYTTTLI